MNRGVTSADIAAADGGVLAIASALTRLRLTGRAFVLAKSWCADDDAFVCWVSNGAGVGIPFVDADLVKAIDRAATWARTKKGDWV